MSPARHAFAFAGELLLLYAAGSEIDTCWFGHYSLKELERVIPHLGVHASDPMPMYGYGKGEVDGRRTICISPLGYWEPNGIRFADRLARRMMSFKRKPLQELMENGLDPHTLPQRIQAALEFARKAPSAANTQHWRFAVSRDFTTVEIAKPHGYKHLKWEHCDMDTGICACHFWLGLQVQGIPCTVTPTRDDDRVAWRFSL